ncbi:MAG: cytochrome C [Deltaproteobacteria bacterium]|nr:cytochrome C [Deltaproteobacteria bacterium]
MITRRSFLQLATGALAPSLLSSRSQAQAKARVVVVGGGFGGATCAKYLRLGDASLNVILIAPQKQFISCPFSNAVIAGLQPLTSVTHTYDTLRRRYGIRVVYATATALDPVKHHITLSDGKTLSYDRAVLAPGIELQWGAVDGYTVGASTIFPHAWEAGPQTELLRRQLEMMPNGGLVVITVPENPYRCPPGPYERASLIAHYVKQHKPRAKVLILDAKDNFTKKELFIAAWKELYSGTLEWIAGSQGGRLQRIDIQKGIVRTDFDEYKPAVANIIPPQRAATIARQVGLDEGKGWCRVRASTFESAVHRDVHIIGDAAITNPIPKSAFGANVEAKACAAAIVSLLRAEPVPEPVLMNTCYSLVAPNYGISITGAYRVENDALVTITGSDGTSPLDAPAEVRAREADYAHSWYTNITADTFS